ncbi:uncharacterized membrane protein YhaH (DUF805 family) [Frondihabitans sp. PhB188]|uniref:DUF805 domain-containing protein n=1 Tax=Frondihabitans sp. PhB188 TaxID=2485200 RepID=UPI000F49239F|nr:DUF805 domain-containing protein [Frondihabitans sp. PhB188]ROQ37004.1 uncharacterized membrane protein YhaH (DUF805 family) [Frondihabitans sp. PhB188]
MSTPPAYPTPAKQQNEPPRDQPYYGASPVAAVKRFFQKYATFSGRASRSEFWWWILANFVVTLILSSIWGASHPMDMTTTTFNFTTFAQQSSDPLSGVWGLITLVPNLAISWRRLHDTNRSGLWILINLIPIVGWIIYIVFVASGPKPEGARFDKR